MRADAVNREFLLHASKIFWDADIAEISLTHRATQHAFVGKARKDVGFQRAHRRQTIDHPPIEKVDPRVDQASGAARRTRTERTDAVTPQCHHAIAGSIIHATQHHASDRV